MVTKVQSDQISM